MNNILQLSKGDPRILSVFNVFFPKSPEFVAYLTNSMKSTNGTIETARLISHHINRVFDQSKDIVISSADVKRLSLESDVDYVARISFKLEEIRPEVMRQAAALSMSLSSEIREREGGLDQEYVAYPRVAVDQNHVVSYLRVYFCACAMILGISLNDDAHQVC